ncbi:MAG TPA: hypothetical protein PK052_11795 [Anaerohalosphaeraceae bacterium]|nr:hypothetical protein [Phycisphaerae bacterium]HOK96717.1 hypothetical protein [Anaerohalosphaeraceae bacterium]HOL32649.1 hypothetical protein [Anaerohalosphaeraceae bacterium]HOM77407.1 hypothetical protein [Anaerohalosphaeraceae bacterium]HPC65476.1 hypothetical protein [Anaerohalosphaeraceae bacterium]
MQANPLRVSSRQDKDKKGAFSRRSGQRPRPAERLGSAGLCTRGVHGV